MSFINTRQETVVAQEKDGILIIICVCLPAGVTSSRQRGQHWPFGRTGSEHFTGEQRTSLQSCGIRSLSPIPYPKPAKQKNVSDSRLRLNEIKNAISGQSQLKRFRFSM